MSGKKGMKHYSASMKAEIQEASGQSVCSLSREYGISRYAIQMLYGLAKDRELFTERKLRGRPGRKPTDTRQALELRVRELEREVALYKAFLHAAGRM